MSIPLIYFDENTHKYTDNMGNTYSSVTTLIGKYENKFEDNAVQIAKNCERIGKNPLHAKHEKYKGKSYTQILKEWEQTKIKACSKGTVKHNYLEDIIKDANGYKRSINNYIIGSIYTVDNIIDKPRYGYVNLSYFEKCGLKDKYPSIYEILKDHTKHGYYMFPELCVYSYEYLISGLIDLPLINYDTKSFKIVDWKTNIDVLTYDAGYYEKDINGGRTNMFIKTNDTLKYPLDTLSNSSGNKYGLQISMYSKLLELKGFKHEENILCHIRNVLEDGFETDKEIVDIHNIRYMKYEVEMMIDHYRSNINKNMQLKLL